LYAEYAKKYAEYICKEYAEYAKENEEEDSQNHRMHEYAAG
jgi:hypothetical protein